VYWFGQTHVYVVQEENQVSPLNISMSLLKLMCKEISQSLDLMVISKESQIHCSKKKRMDFLQIRKLPVIAVLDVVS
jgi:hypothetical protein